MFFPAVLAASAVFGQGRSPACRSALTAAALLQPAAVLIDHGHFQYNNICLGLAVSAHQESPHTPPRVACLCLLSGVRPCDHRSVSPMCRQHKRHALDLLSFPMAGSVTGCSRCHPAKQTMLAPLLAPQLPGSAGATQNAQKKKSVPR